ncbi:MAG: hypothetical protein V1726_05605 [Methanobacteriota archaeon]
MTTSLLFATSIPSETTAVPQNTDTQQVLQFTYTFTTPVLQQCDDGSQVNMNELKPWGQPGLPSLPVKDARILLPPNTSVKKIRVTPGEKVVLSGSHYLPPIQEPHFFSETAPTKTTEQNPAIYESTDPYPGILYQSGGVQKSRGYNIFF